MDRSLNVRVHKFVGTPVTAGPPAVCGVVQNMVIEAETHSNKKLSSAVFCASIDTTQIPTIANYDKTKV